MPESSHRVANACRRDHEAQRDSALHVRLLNRMLPSGMVWWL
jgi:hypothetical protein